MTKYLLIIIAALLGLLTWEHDHRVAAERDKASYEVETRRLELAGIQAAEIIEKLRAAAAGDDCYNRIISSGVRDAIKAAY